jgi:hypothetical protein
MKIPKKINILPKPAIYAPFQVIFAAFLKEYGYSGISNARPSLPRLLPPWRINGGFPYIIRHVERHMHVTRPAGAHPKTKSRQLKIGSGYGA